jgi:signal transduction histidine kinase
VLQRLLDIGALIRNMQGEWLVQESLRALPVDPADFARLLVFGGLWTLGISWLLACFVFRRKKDEDMALYVAYLLLIFPFGVGPGTRPTPLIEALSFLGIAMGILFLFIFPDGRFVPQSRRWRSALVSLILLAPPLGYILARLLRPGEAHDSWGYAAFIFTITAVMVAGGAGQLYRYRYLSDAVEQRQTRWVLLALALQILFFMWVALWIGGIPGSLGLPESLLALITLGIMFVANAALPLSLAVAVLVDRLWQMDLVLNRTLVFGGLTALVIALYVLVVGVLGTLFRSGNSLLLSILATGLIAVLFNPLRQRLQQGVNRLMYGQRDDPLAVLSELGRQLENTAVPGETLPALVETIAETLKLPYVAIETRTAEEGGRLVAVAAANGNNPPQGIRAYRLAYQGTAVGDLLVAPRAAGESFTPEEERLLGNIARQASTAVYAEQLTAQLQRSRERLVAAREEERRRLRRDLHDGLGPQLAALTVKIDAARNLMQSDPETAEKLLLDVKSGSQGAISEIRRVVDGLRPPALDQLGLVSALQEFTAQHGAGTGTVIQLDIAGDYPLLPAAVEVAAYRIITEAVTNAGRHAGAKRCTIRLRIAECGVRSKEHIPHPTSHIPHQLCIEIIDDGVGLPSGYQAGVGLASMRERALELGGIFEIESLPGQGTAVRIALPITKPKEST